VQKSVLAQHFDEVSSKSISQYSLTFLDEYGKTMWNTWRFKCLCQESNKICRTYIQFPFPPPMKKLGCFLFTWLTDLAPLRKFLLEESLLLPFFSLPFPFPSPDDEPLPEAADHVMIPVNVEILDTLPVNHLVLAIIRVTT